MAGTANVGAGGDLFRHLLAEEKRTFQINWTGRLIGTEVPNAFGFSAQTGISAIASATAFYSGVSAVNGTAVTGVIYGSALSTVTISGQNNFSANTAYAISAWIATDANRRYVEVFRVWSHPGFNVDG